MCSLSPSFPSENRMLGFVSGNYCGKVCGLRKNGGNGCLGACFSPFPPSCPPFFAIFLPLVEDAYNCSRDLMMIPHPPNFPPISPISPPFPPHPPPHFPPFPPIPPPHFPPISPHSPPISPHFPPFPPISPHLPIFPNVPRRVPGRGDFRFGALRAF